MDLLICLSARPKGPRPQGACGGGACGPQGAPEGLWGGQLDHLIFHFFVWTDLIRWSWFTFILFSIKRILRKFLCESGYSCFSKF